LSQPVGSDTWSLMSICAAPRVSKARFRTVYSMNQYGRPERGELRLFSRRRRSDAYLRPLLGEQRARLTLLRDKVRSALASGGKISDNERERIVSDLQQSFPHYSGAASLPPNELMRASIG
jgi:hypothetical protein